MKSNIFSLVSHGRVGPSGWKCACCAAPRGKRKADARAHKKRVKKILDKLQEAA